MHRLTLIGFRASGKSSIGRLVAARLAWPFVDLDSNIEERIGMSIAQYFQLHGEAAFRECEALTVRQVLQQSRVCVIATGGGAVLRADNRQCLREHGGLVVYIAPPIEAIQERLTRNAGGRPSLTGASVADEAAALLAQRDPLYREIAQVVFVPHATVAQSADALAALVLARLETA